MAAHAVRAATEAAATSLDPSTRVGAALVDHDGAVLGVGHNGLPPGVAALQERWERPAKYMWVQHAEIAAMCDAARRGACVEGATAAVTTYPCAACAGALIAAGVRVLVAPPPPRADTRWAQDWAVAERMLGEAGVEVLHP